MKHHAHRRTLPRARGGLYATALCGCGLWLAGWMPAQGITESRPELADLFTTPASRKERSPESTIAAPPRTLAAGWQEVRRLLASADTAAALAALDALAAHFDSEPEYLAALPQLLPLYAQLCLANDRAEDAAQHYRQWLALPQSQTLLPQRIEVFAALATACERNGDTAGAQEALQGLVAIAPPQDARSQFARLQQATLLAQTGQTQQALAALQALLQQPDYPAPLRTRARLQAIYLALENGADEQAASLLLHGEPWEIAQMPELAQLSFAATQVADYLLQEQRPQEALHAIDLITPQPQLLHLQRLRQADVARALQRQSHLAAEGSTQAAAAAQFLALQIAQIDRQLQLLEAQGDSAAPWFYRKASALLEANRPWQAAILFTEAAKEARAQAERLQQSNRNTAAPQTQPENTRLADSERTEIAAGHALANRADYNRLLALHKAGRTERLQEEAEHFVKSATSLPLALQARNLQVESLLQSKRYTEALTLLDNLLLQEPALSQSTPLPATQEPALQAYDMPADSAALLHFHRGYTHAMLGNYADARADFTLAANISTTSQASLLLHNWALYWSAQSDILSGNYLRARERLAEILPQIDPAHPAFAHARFSHAQALYANGAAEQAQAALDTFLQEWPQHERANNAHLLLAESLIASGRTQAALDALGTHLAAGVEPLAGQAALRKGIVLEQQEELQRALALYLGYLQTFDHLAPTLRLTTDNNLASSQLAAPPEPLTGSYSQSVGRATRLLLMHGQAEQAAKLLQSALLEQGNDATFGDFSEIIRHAFQSGMEPDTLSLPVPQPPPAINTARRYAQWLQTARQSALRAGQSTLYARFSGELANHYTRTGRLELQQAILLQIAANTPPDQLDTATLESVTRLLAELDHSLSNTYLAQLAARYRNLPEPAALLWAQAHNALHTGNLRLAANLLQRLGADWPTHPLRLETFALLARLAHASDNPAEARSQWLALLEQRGSTPAQRAQALLALGRLHTQANQLQAAINYYQRLYTLYRAQPKPLIAAYTESAPLFEALGDLPAALATYNELLRSADVVLPLAVRDKVLAEQTRLFAALQQPAQHTRTANTPDQQTEAPAEADSPPTVAAASLATTEAPDNHTMATVREDSTATANEGSTATVSTPQVPELAVVAGLAANLTDTPVSPTAANPSVAATATAQHHLPAANAAPEALLGEALPQTGYSNNSEWQRLLRAPAQVSLIHGATLTGDVLGIENNVLHLRLRQQGDGIGETTLPLERVLRIDFADEPLFAHTDALTAGGRQALAYARRKQWYANRERALAFVSNSTLQRIADLADEALQRGEPLLAVRISKRSLPALEPQHHHQPLADDSPQHDRPTGRNAPNHYQRSPLPQLQTQLQDAELLGLWRLGLHEQAVAAAESRLAGSTGFAAGAEAPLLKPMSPTTQRSVAPASALPHAVLASVALSNGDADTALELALCPIALSPPMALRRNKDANPPHLATAYAVALAAAEALEADAVRSGLMADANAESILVVNTLALPAQTPHR